MTFFRQWTKGQGVVQYALTVILVVAVALIVLFQKGNPLSSSMNSMYNKLTNKVVSIPSAVSS
jgi:hypothetical protein